MPSNAAMVSSRSSLGYSIRLSAHTPPVLLSALFGRLDFSR
jgi:hypothetical protein